MGYNVTCPFCGGKIIGDGYTSPLRCENSAGFENETPDSGPFFCESGETGIAALAKDIVDHSPSLLHLLLAFAPTGKPNPLYGLN
jgi:hypothetical protein